MSIKEVTAALTKLRQDWLIDNAATRRMNQEQYFNLINKINHLEQQITQLSSAVTGIAKQMGVPNEQQPAIHDNIHQNHNNVDAK